MSLTEAPILIVEDEPKLARLMADYLAAAGYATEWLADGREVAAHVAARMPALVLLDVMLPGRDGLEICRDLRQQSSDVPIVMVTARVEEIDRLLGLELGADDYICKPFSPRELVARVKAILRRIRPSVPSDEPVLRIDEAFHQIRYRGVVIDLTPVEFRLLKTLAEAPGRVFSRDRLLDRLYHDHRVVTDRTVDSHIKNLRRKMQQVAPGEEPIRSIYGVGYKLEL